MRKSILPGCLAGVLLIAFAARAESPRWLPGQAFKVPSQYTNQESGYFSIVEGQNGRVYIGAAKYGVNAYLIEFDPKTSAMKVARNAPRDFGVVAVANPDFTKFTDDKGQPLPWHHTMRKAKDGTLTPWVPMGVCGAKDGGVYVLTIAPFTLIKLKAEQVR